MIRQYKIVLLICLLALVCNLVVKLSIINRQADRVTVLQKVVAAARAGKYIQSEDSRVEEPANLNDVTQFIRLIPDNLTFTEYMVKVRNLIDKNNLSLTNSLVFKPENTKRNDLIKYRSNFSAIGSYPHIKQLLSDMQNMPGLVYIDGMKISREKDNPSMVRLNIEVFIFFRQGIS